MFQTFSQTGFKSSRAKLEPVNDPVKVLTEPATCSRAFLWRNLELLQELLMVLDQSLVLILVPSDLSQARVDLNQLEVDQYAALHTRTHTHQ